jgi:coenzyme F420-reducing hydrogenase beta subunit
VPDLTAVYKEKSACCGCSLCEYICPENAIKMVSDGGFLYPEINPELCIDCGLCAKKCPFTEDKKTDSSCLRAYAVKHKDENVINASSSGGIFTALSDYILSQDGCIIGADFDGNMNVIHTVADTPEKRDRMRGSKYIQSNMSGIYSLIENILKKEKPVLFTGTPCQAAAIKKAFPKYANLYIIDIICHGVPSPEVWKKYVLFIEKTYGKKLTFYSFRDKEKAGWRTYSAKLTFDDGTAVQHNDITGSFIELFRYDVCMRQSCTKCPFATVHRQGDITIGDFWGIESVMPEISDNKGVSAVMLNSEKGRALFNKVSDSISCFPCAQADIAKKQPNMSAPSQYSNKAEGFSQDIKAMPFDEVLKKYTRVGIRRRLIDTAKSVIYSIKK